MTNKVDGSGQGPEIWEDCAAIGKAEMAKESGQAGEKAQAEGSGAPNAKQTARPKSMSAHDMGLQSQLEERLKAAGAGGAKKSDATAEVLDGADAEWAQLEKEAAGYKGKLDQAFPGYKVKAEVTDFGAFSFELTPKGGGKPTKVELQTIDEYTIKMTAPDGKSKSVGVVYGDGKPQPDFGATVRDFGKQLGMSAAKPAGGAKVGHAGTAAGIGSKDYNAGIDALFQATIKKLGDSQMSLKPVQQPKRAGEPFLWELKGPGWVNPLSVQLKDGKLSVLVPGTGEEAASVKLKMPADASPPSLNAFRRELEAKSAELASMFG